MDSAYLEVGIGLAVVFFVVATVADGLNEVVTRTLNTRAKALWATIHGLLESEIADRPHIGTGFILRAAAPSWIARRLPGKWNQDFRPIVGRAALEAQEAARAWVEQRIATLGAADDSAVLSAVADKIRELTGEAFDTTEKALRQIEHLGYEQLLAVAALVGIDVEVKTLYPPLQVEATRRRLSVHLRHELDRDQVATWAVTRDDPAALLGAALPLTGERRRVLMDSVSGIDRERIATAGPTEAFRIALADRTPDEQTIVVIDALAGDGGEELTRRWMTDTAQPTESDDTLAAWLVAKPAGQQLTLLQRTTVTGRSATAAARTAELLAMASIEGLDYVRRNGRKTKVWWIDGRAFGSAIWEAAKRYDPDPDDGPLDVNTSARISAIADEWAGTPLGDYLKTTGVDHAESVDRFVEAIGAWFDGQMDRLSMTYRRNVKWVLGIFGAGMALVFNVNAVGLTDALLDDAAARQTLVSYADDLVERCGDEPTENQDVCFGEIDEKLDGISRLDELGIPLVSDEWEIPFIEDGWEIPIISDPEPDETDPTPGAWDWLAWVLGIGITSIAVSQGGTFWFDFLKLLTGIRRRR